MVKAEVIGVNSLEVIAAQAPADVDRLSAVLDAQRQQVFAGEFARGPGGGFAWIGGTTIKDNDAWLAGLEPPFRRSRGLQLDKLAARFPARYVSAVGQELWALARRPSANLAGDYTKPASATTSGVSSPNTSAAAPRKKNGSGNNAK